MNDECKYDGQRSSCLCWQCSCACGKEDSGPWCENCA